MRGKQIVSGAELKYKFYRSWTSYQPLPVRVTGNGIAALRLYYRRYPQLKAKWSVTQMVTRDGAFQAFVPGQPAAGKMTYKVEIVTPTGTAWLNGGIPIVARFKGAVPLWLLLLHVHFMFAGLILAFRTGLEALRRDGR